jgi:hypothetical protein
MKLGVQSARSELLVEAPRGPCGAQAHAE